MNAITEHNNALYSRAMAIYFSCIFVVGFFFVFLVTPISGVDEQYHFDRALQVSQGGMLPKHLDGGGLGGKLNGQLVAYAQYFEGQRDRRLPSDRATAMDLSHRLTSQPRTDEVVDFPSTASYSPIMYVPSGLGLLAGHVFHTRVDTQFYLGRIGNLVGYLLSLMLVVRVLPWGRLGVIALFTTPTCLHLASAYSADPLTNTLTLLFIACCLRAISNNTALTRKEIVLFVVLSAILGLLKITCCIFSLAVLMIPSSLFPSRQRWGLFCASVVVCSVATALIWNKSFPFVPSIYWNTGGNPKVALHVFLTKPWHVASMVIEALREGSQWWWLDIYGRFGGGPEPQFFKVGANTATQALVCIGLIGLFEQRPESMRWAGSLLATIALGSACFILLAFYLGFTPVSSAIITGVQGRYFLLAAGLTYLGAVSILPASRDRLGTAVGLFTLTGLFTLKVSVIAMEIYTSNWH